MLFSINTFADTFQRIELLGSASSGDTIAIIKSHFGPSSYAPFVTFEIYKSESSLPAFQDGMSSLQGDETTITELKNNLIKKNEYIINEYGINLKPNSFNSINSIVADFDNQFLVEADLYDSGSISRFNFYYTGSDKYTCPNNKTPLTLRFCSYLDEVPTHCSTIEPVIENNNLSCFADKANFSRAFKIGEYVWFLFFYRTEPLEGLYFYPQYIWGSKIK